MTTAPSQIPMVDYLVLDEHQPTLVAQCCTACEALYFDRRNGCARCGGVSFKPRTLQPTGFVRTFTIVHRAAPKVPAPYISAVIELDGGGVIKANIVGVECVPEAVPLGGRVRLTTFVAGVDDDGTEAVAFGFAPDTDNNESKVLDA
jgi:uncharacterized OB-fold protein